MEWERERESSWAHTHYSVRARDLQTRPIRDNKNHEEFFRFSTEYKLWWYYVGFFLLSISSFLSLFHPCAFVGYAHCLCQKCAGSTMCVYMFCFCCCSVEFGKRTGKTTVQTLVDSALSSHIHTFQCNSFSDICCRIFTSATTTVIRELCNRNWTIAMAPKCECIHGRTSPVETCFIMYK